MKFSTLPWRLQRALQGLLLLQSAYVSASPSINVALKASFNSAPYLLELLETAAQENSSSYFPLLDRIASGTFADLSTDEQLYNHFLQTVQDDGHLTDPESLASFKFALSIRSAAPRIEAHYQYYDTSVEPSMMVAQDAACPVWVYFEGKQYCSPDLEHAQQDAGSKEYVDFEGMGWLTLDRGTRELPFDRVLGAPSEGSPTILYADISSRMFGDFHHALSSRAKDGQNSYRLRYRPSTSPMAGQPLFVNGYGVELVLKRTDYIVIDDRQAEKQNGNGHEAVTPGDGLTEEALDDLKPLSSKDVANLGVNAASFVMNSEDPFATLLKLSEDFPKHSSAIANYNATEEFLNEFHANRNTFLPTGYNVMWINGLQIDPRQIDAFSLLEHLRHERKLINGLKDLGFTALEARRLLSHSALTDSQTEEEAQRYDYRDTSEGGKVILWLNDIEKDKRYEGWPTSPHALVQRVYPGQLPTVRRDIHNVIIPLDFSDAKDVQLLLEALQGFVKRKVPVRFGLVPILQSPGAVEQAMIVYHLLDTYGLNVLFSYLETSLAAKKIAFPHKLSFETAIKERKLRKDQESLSFDTILKFDDSNAKVNAAQTYLRRLSADGKAPVFFTNGVAIPRDDSWLQAMSYRINRDLQQLQRGVVEEVFQEDSWMPNFFLFQASHRRNALVIPEDTSTIKFANLRQLHVDFEDQFKKQPKVSAIGDSGKQDWAHLAVIADFDTEDGLKLLADAVEFATSKPEVEILMLHNPESSGSSDASVRLYKLFEGSGEPNLVAVAALIKEFQAWHDELDKEFGKHEDQYWKEAQPIAEAMGFEPGQKGLVFNGRLVGPIPPVATFNVEDFSQLFDYERAKRSTPVMTALSGLTLEDKLSDRLMLAKISSIIARSRKSDVPEGIYEGPPNVRMDRFNAWNSTYSSFSVSNSSDPSIEIITALDLTTEVSQRWVPILKALSELDGVDLKVFLNPREKIQEIPIKRFYRHVLYSQPTFDASGSLDRPEATFTGIPTSALLNLGMDVPPSWLVAAEESVHDLDNIKLSSLPTDSSITAIFELENILIEGHSREMSSGAPPRGVQLLLGTDKSAYSADTIIMANLGYFQFKANPGFWKITLKPGRSSKIFSLDSIGSMGYSPQPGDLTTEVSLLSFQGVTLFPRLSRKPGHEEDDVLLPSSAKPGSPASYLSKGLDYASNALNSVGLFKNSEHADINIFSVASGHLYERMLAIMMRSVLKHTKHTVKFWFIEQFLSPSFKSFLPTLAAHYNFKYELITYKWPHWLRSQKEKQREIWGYKILFLDVLFPLSLDKVIFVDADQIVRTDMYDLVQHDLQGAPYGFTPMCDSRTEMEGFRFWKTGYWKSFLRGLPYHISALYVVDLKKFREIAAGDRLRQQYHQLSADPASLSNLDQDLPNHMQMNIPIHSLPQEWLWCETWCSDESLGSAKTIDLCNNPLTKEPKLDRARRQVPEWTEYDEEIGAIRREWEGKEMKEAEGDGEGVDAGKGERVRDEL